MHNPIEIEYRKKKIGLCKEGKDKEGMGFPHSHTTAALLVPRLYSGTTNGLSSPTGWLGRSLYPLAY